MSNSWAQGSDTRWRTFRARILIRDHNLCRIGDKGCTQVATEVDHIVPLHLDGAKYDPSNCRAACGPCNRGRKRATLDPQPTPQPVSRW